MKITQDLVDRIVARAKASPFGLGDPSPGKSYNLALYTPTIEGLALLLVSAHHDKYDLVSIMAAAITETSNP